MKLDTTIVTSPTDFSLIPEIRLLKTSLLYSDNILLISPGLTSTLALLRLANSTEKEKIEYLKALTVFDSTLNGDEYEKIIILKNKLLQKRGKSKQEVVLLQRLQNKLKELDNGFEEWGQNIFISSGLPEFQHLIDQGIITLKHLDINEVNEKMAIQILNETINAISSDNNYPLFDNLVEEAANVYLEETGFSKNFQDLNEIFVGKEFILKIPNIDSLTFDHIIKIKEELNTELSKFKGLILDYASEVEGLAFTSDNKKLIHKRYQYDFIPQLNDLQENINRNSFFKHLYKEMGENITKYGIFLGVADIENLLKITVGAGGSALAEGIYKAYNSQKNLSRENKKNSVYFYHQLAQMK